MLSGYWTDGVGCSIETLAELIGDTPKVAFDHYGKEWGQHYQDPLWAAIGESPKADGKQKRGPSSSSKVASSRARDDSARRGKGKQTKRSTKRGKKR